MSKKSLQMQRSIVLSRMKMNFRVDCFYRIEIDGQPDNFNMFPKEVSYGLGTIESDSISIRTGDINIPSKRTAGSVTVVFNDDEDGTSSNFIKSLQDKIFNDDGTQNLPVDYLIQLRIYRLKQDDSERLEAEWSVYVEENNDYTGSNESRTELGTFSVTFKKYKSIGK